MFRNLKLRNYKITKLQNRSRGYVLLTLMLFFSLLAIAALAVLPDVAFQVKRDREEELIHRGVEYSRAIRRYYRKLGRYPSRIEELESTNNQRFLRKRFKDPVTGRDFKILRMGDPQLATVTLGQIPGLPQPNVGSSKQTTSKQTQVTNTDAEATDSADTGSAAGAPVETTGESPSPDADSGSGGTGQTFGGGPILGVVSTSKRETIREFCSKTHYKDWLFIYDPNGERGGVLKTPWCPGVPIQGLNPPPQTPPVAPSPPNTGAPGTVPTQPNAPGDLPPQQ